MVVLENNQGKRKEISEYDFLFAKEHLTNFLFVKSGRKIIVVKGKKKVGEVIFPTYAIPRKAYDLEVEYEFQKRNTKDNDERSIAISNRDYQHFV